MSFDELLFRAKAGDMDAKAEIFAMYRPLLIKNALVNGRFDEDLYQELAVELMKCIRGSVKNFVALVKNGSFLVRITDMTILIEKEFIYGSSKRPNPTDYYRKQHYQCG